MNTLRSGDSINKEDVITQTRYSRQNDIFEVSFVSKQNGLLFVWSVSAVKYRRIIPESFQNVAKQAIKEVESAGGCDKFYGAVQEDPGIREVKYANAC